MNKSFHIIISVAGKREHENLARTIPRLKEIFSALELIALAKEKNLSIYLQTGLADGADMESTEALLRWEHGKRTEIWLTAIFPYPKEEYLQTIQQRERFEELCKRCSRKVILDGRYLSGEEPFPKECRGRAYRQQADYLLQACDVLLAITDETETVKAGGTIETVGLALKKDIPVIFLSLKHICFFWLSKPADFRNLRSTENPPIAEHPEVIARLVLGQVWLDSSATG